MRADETADSRDESSGHFLADWKAALWVVTKTASKDEKKDKLLAVSSDGSWAVLMVFLKVALRVL
jgi:hypothetical protein